MSRQTRVGRLLPVDPETRSVALDLYERVAQSRIVSPHGHVPIAWLDEDATFSDPASLLVTHDHYVTRMLHAAGVPLDRLDVKGETADPHDVWRILADHWHLFAGTASGYWLEDQLGTIFGIEEILSPRSADSIYDSIAGALMSDAFRPRALFEQFGIDVLATTDDPLDDLAAHARVGRSGLSGRVIPTFRPDAYLDPDHTAFASNVTRLAEETGHDTSFTGYVRALEDRRAHFRAHGAVSTDHGVIEPYTTDLDTVEAERLFHACLVGSATPSERRTFRGHMLFQMARMSVDDGLVMTIHAGVRRNHHQATFERYGPDTGHDIPIPTSFTDGLRPLLNRFGLESNLHLVLFAVDETVYSRELAPLAGFYPSVFVGAPWWFLDAPDAMARFRSAVTETAGFYRTSGFIDDTRAYLSIPTRHDVSRRSDASFLARLVREGRISMESAQRIIDDLVAAIPKRVFKL